MNRTCLVMLGLAVVCILSGCAGSRAAGLMQMRLAEVEEIPGLLEFRNPNPDGLNDRIYVETRILASDRDVEAADAIRTDNDTYAVAVTLTEPATTRLLRAWSKDLRGRLAIFIDGRPVCTVPMFGQFDRNVVISGRFNRRYAESIADQLNRGRNRAITMEDLDMPAQEIPGRINLRKK